MKQREWWLVHNEVSDRWSVNREYYNSMSDHVKVYSVIEKSAYDELRNALDYIAGARGRACQKEGCTCIYDTAKYALEGVSMSAHGAGSNR
jgi:hypothetical protein